MHIEKFGLTCRFLWNTQKNLAHRVIKLISLCALYFFYRMTHRLIGLSFDATKVSCPGVLAPKEFIGARFATSIGAALWKRNKKPLTLSSRPPLLPHAQFSFLHAPLFSRKKHVPTMSPPPPPSQPPPPPQPQPLCCCRRPHTLSAVAGRLQMESEAPRRRLLRAPTDGLYGR